MVRQTRYYSEKPFLEREWEPTSLPLRKVEEGILKATFTDYPSPLDELEKEITTSYLWDRDLSLSGKVAAQLVIPEGFEGGLSLHMKEGLAWLKVLVPTTAKARVEVKVEGLSFLTVEWFVHGSLHVESHALSTSMLELRHFYHLYGGAEVRDEVRALPYGSASLRVLSQLNHWESSKGRSVAKALLREGRASMEGLIRVAPSAKVDSYLEQYALLLSEKALVYQYPSLEIAHNDVKASHSASSFYVDEEDLFYLQSRGLSKAEALRLIAEGFMEPFAFPRELGEVVSNP